MGTPDASGLGDPFDLGAERLALALQSSDLGFWDFDLVNLKGSFTKACAEIFGLPHAAEPGQISYAEWLEAIHPEDRAKAQGDNRQRRAIRFIGIIRDVTQHQLRKKGDCRRRGTISSSDSRGPIPILVSGDNGKVVELNRAWQEVTGYSMIEIPTVESWSQLAWSEQDGNIQPKRINATQPHI